MKFKYLHAGKLSKLIYNKTAMMPETCNSILKIDADSVSAWLIMKLASRFLPTLAC